MNLPSRYSFNGTNNNNLGDALHVSAQNLNSVIRPGFINWNNTPGQVSFDLKPTKPTIDPKQLDAKKLAGKGYVAAKSMHGYGDDATTAAPVAAPATDPSTTLTAPQASAIANPVVVTPTAAATVPATAPTKQHKIICMLVCVVLGAAIACMVCKRR